ncbi:hypothetical protein B0T16DRAFT_389951 [Cercophora newfieldiana]|uniref:Uncharacterized protein n=1 Tax=Cercophora newfieldiana TaxID=92897 RepID=A0AA39YEE9_9PEZI|nr:hypothetical protein B0T16DRAFT_389951 [Cercophora newfieldiana]
MSEQDQKQSSRASSPTLNGDQKTEESTQTRTAYTYVQSVGTPNPDAKPKTKGKFASFLSKFQSPAVKASTAIRDREQLEQERTGVKKVQVTDTGRSSNAWVLS